MAEEAAPYDAGNRRHVERKAKGARARQRRLDEDLRWLMGDARGRRLMWARLTEAGIFQTSMRQTPEWTAFREGRREMGLIDIGEIMRVCPDLYSKMQAEAQSKAATNPKGEDDGE